MRKWIVILLMSLMAVPAGTAAVLPDDNDTTATWQRPIRRLHPERERDKAMKKLKEQMSRQAEVKADPWDTSDEMWGTVDVPASVRSNSAVTGHRLNDKSQTDENSYRLTWRDEPVTATVDQLMPFFTVTETDEYRSKYVLVDSASNEVYFAFDMNSDSLPGPLRLCVRYCTDAQMIYDQLTFTVDGYDYMFYPMDPQCRQMGVNQYVVCSDDVLQPVYKDLVYALAHGSWVMCKLHLNGGVTRVKVLTDGQREDFSIALDLYRLLGGVL